MEITYIGKMVIACVGCIVIMWLVFPNKKGE